MIKYIIILFFHFNFLIAQLEANLIASGFDQPLYIKNYPNDNDMLLIVEQDGIIKIVQNMKIKDFPFLDITDRVHQTWYPADERGLLGLTFDPSFEKNNFFYINYINQDGFSIISRFKVNNGLGNPDSEEILLKLKQPYMNHNGGFLEFGPDGYLYISIGDGGSAGDPEKRAQDLSNLFGTIIRIDVSNEGNYIIPESNPFFNHSKFKNEIWHYGLRNVWRFSFDKENGDLYMGDVGQNEWEEIDYHAYNSPSGLNYGWNILEGNHCYGEDIKNCNSNDTVLPIFEYPNDANYAKTIVGWDQPDMYGCSVTGGYVYRGQNKPELYGRYIFGDYCTGKVWSLLNNGEDNSLINHTDELLNSMDKTEFYLSSFGQDENGELYLIDYAGDVYSITK
jgi:glucose/arabinose dehydrogenase